MFQVVYTYTKEDSTTFDSDNINEITQLADPCIMQKSSYNETQKSVNFLGFDAVLSEDGQTLTVYESWNDAESYFAYQQQLEPTTDTVRKVNVTEGYTLTTTSRTV